MSTIVLRPTIISVDSGVTWVGDTDTLADESDSTYVVIPPADVDASGPGPHLVFPTATIPAGVDYTATFALRGYVATGVAVQTELVSTAGRFLTGTTSATVLTDVDPVEIPATPGDFYYGDLIGGLAGVLVNDSAFDNAITITRMSLTIEWAGGGVAPPCRIHPREDHLGAGSGRIWPPPRSHQASPRRAGGYY